MVYVDELKVYNQPAKPGSERWFGNGKESCHLTADSVEELHDFAQRRLGLDRFWFQDGRHPHYDLTPPKRAQALRAGARDGIVLKSARQLGLEL